MHPSVDDGDDFLYDLILPQIRCKRWAEQDGRIGQSDKRILRLINDLALYRLSPSPRPAAYRLLEGVAVAPEWRGSMVKVTSARARRTERS